MKGLGANHPQTETPPHDQRRGFFLSRSGTTCNKIRVCFLSFHCVRTLKSHVNRIPLICWSHRAQPGTETRRLSALNCSVEPGETGTKPSPLLPELKEALWGPPLRFARVLRSREKDRHHPFPHPHSPRGGARQRIWIIYKYIYFLLFLNKKTKKNFSSQSAIG